MRRGLVHPLEALAAVRGQLFPFAPVCLGLGIGVYFLLPRDPSPAQWGLIGLAVAVLALLGWRGPNLLQPLALAAALAGGGLALAGGRAQMVAAPVLERHYYGAIEGRIVAIDRSLSDAQRLTLDEVVLEGMDPAVTPRRVRVSLHGEWDYLNPTPGMRVILTGHLSPPGGPVEPGGFEFRRLAWFEGLGGVGYTRTPALKLAPAQRAGPVLAIDRLRMRISQAVRAQIPGEAGGFAAAVLTGDRSGVGRDTLDDLRGSNLAHLLAISGLHMGLLTGFVFAAMRYGLALIPPLALRLDTRKLAALVALGAAAFYLALSGGNVATQRAFVMVCVMLVAVLADRRAISLRSVALAALILLVLRPESLISAGFQMSFAATTALVAVFSTLRDAQWPTRRLPRWVEPVLALVVCSFVAGLATAPVAAAHFNRIAEYGLLANVLSVPMMGTLVIPSAVLAALLAPLGLSLIPLRVMELGTRWILGVAEWVAGLEGAVTPVVQPAPWVLPAMALGALWLILWPGRARWAGIAAVALSLAGWAKTERPPLLIADTGSLIGVLTPEGRVLSKASGERFVSRAWLEADGDGASPEDAHRRSGLAGGSGTLRFKLGGVAFVHLTGRGASDRVKAHCHDGTVIILGADSDGAPPGPCRLIDRGSLATSGSLAVHEGRNGPEYETARTRAGQRPWSGNR